MAEVVDVDALGRPGDVPYGRVLAKACADCGADLVLRPSRRGPFYGCDRFPECRGGGGAPAATGDPLGTPAGAADRLARKCAHAAFDALWRGYRPVIRGRSRAYAWLAREMDRAVVHIAELKGDELVGVVELCVRKLKQEL